MQVCMNGHDARMCRCNPALSFATQPMSIMMVPQVREMLDELSCCASSAAQLLDHFRKECLSEGGCRSLLVAENHGFHVCFFAGEYIGEKFLLLICSR
jgi:hypothetical protein